MDRFLWDEHQAWGPDNLQSRWGALLLRAACLAAPDRKDLQIRVLQACSFVYGLVKVLKCIYEVVRKG